ncbi:NAD(P)/FAD-dependent oxidoreductase [Streptomyces cremeus]|uniref:Flavin monoamine oxidase family protein n=1 Tax=Streptomyces cremeus TaxID=66881 RepID=A0ABV5P5V9_STRCM
MSAQPPPPADLQVDFPFDYAAHVAGDRRIGRLPEAARGAPVAVIGAGGSGLAAAYELLRTGCRPLVYEAERSADGPGGVRLGGRMYSRRLHKDDSAVVELGCMRFPDSARLLWQYAQMFGLHWEPFRDDYAAGTTPITALEIDGVRHLVREITDLYPLDEEIRHAHTRWLDALTRLGLDQLQRDLARRDLGAVRRRWQEVVRRYEQWTFYRFLREDEGAGLTHNQARLLGTTGVAPAAWDTFFGLSLLETLRLVLTSEGSTAYYPREGISALAEGFWSHRTTDPSGRSTSLEEVNGGTPRPAVTAVVVDEDPRRGAVVHSADGRGERVAAVVLTPQLNVLETAIELRSASAGRSPLGPRMWRAVRRLSYRQSSKTALVVDEPFWQGTTLDGVTLTDRLPRACYTFDYGPPRAPGGRTAVLDLSFSWGRDAVKVSASSQQERVELFVRDLARIHPEIAGELRRQADRSQAVTISWENEAHFRGLCRFSAPGEYPYQRDLFSHFMKDFTGQPAVPGEPPNALFFAGDDTSWSSGWLEHALASGLNAAWGVVRLLGGRCEPGNPGPGDMWNHPDYAPVEL